MQFDFTDAETDYLHRVLLTRPMGEVEALVLKVRQQVNRQQPPQLAPASTDDEPKEATP